MRILLLIIFSIQIYANEVKVCLRLTVGNDEEVIRDCLKSVKDLVDYYTIVNNGSKDQTIKIIENFFEKHQIAEFEESSYCLEDVYILQLEPDSKLCLSPSFTKNSLTEPTYLILEKWPNLDRYFPRLYRVGMESMKNPIKMLGLEVVPSLHSGRKKDSFESGIIQTGVKNYPKAITCFEDRIKKGGSGEEIWYSKYMIGYCYEQMGNWDKALICYLDAYQTDPNRREPLQKISSFYRYKGQNDLSHLFASYGNRLTVNDDHLLLDPSYADYKLLEELSIASYYTQFYSDGLVAINDLMLSKEAPWHAKELASKNILFYVKNIPDARLQPIKLELPFIEDSDEKYHPMNPSIWKTEQGYQVICRSVNYTQQGAKFFQTKDPEGVFRTRNFLLSYDREFNLLSQAEIEEPLRKPYVHASFVEGFEDCRIFQYKDDFWFACTTRDGNVGGVPQMALCKIEEEGPFIPLKGPDQNRCEKNWLPFIRNDELQMIYSADPFLVYRPDLENGNCEKILEYFPPFDFSRFRGSASPIPFDNGYLMMVHEVSFLEDGSRVYLHRFLFLDPNLNIEKVSMPFTFIHQGVEYCCGMALSHSEQELVMTIGIEDHQAFFAFIDLRHVRSMLLNLGDS